MSQIGKLIEESRDLERRAGEIQGDQGLQLDDTAFDDIVSDYPALALAVIEGPVAVGASIIVIPGANPEPVRR